MQLFFVLLHAVLVGAADQGLRPLTDG